MREGVREGVREEGRKGGHGLIDQLHHSPPLHVFRMMIVSSLSR